MKNNLVVQEKKQSPKYYLAVKDTATMNQASNQMSKHQESNQKKQISFIESTAAQNGAAKPPKAKT